MINKFPLLLVRGILYVLQKKLGKPTACIVVYIGKKNMKKSLIGLMITAIFALSACDEKSSQASLECEKKLAQQESHLMAKESELSQLKAELAKAQEKLTHNANLSFPALQVKPVQLIDEKEYVSFKKDPNDEYERDPSVVRFFASSVKTGVEWLDNLLLKDLLAHYANVGQNKISEKNELNYGVAKSFFEQRYQEGLKQVKEDRSIGYERVIETNYEGQRNDLVMFSQHYYYYDGGAHGMNYTNYVNIDVNKKAIIQLDDLVSQKNQPKLRNLLWERYIQDHTDGYGKTDPNVIDKKDFTVSGNFYFKPYGISFVYPVYTLGPYSEGVVEIFASFYDLKDLINKAYLRESSAIEFF